MFGLRECALGGAGIQPRIPAWLEKWTALILMFVEQEQCLLPKQLLALPPPLNLYTPFSAAAEAKGEQSPAMLAPKYNPALLLRSPLTEMHVCTKIGVSNNRLQNIVITLDKVKLCLNKPDQCRNCPLRLLSEAEVVEYLWSGKTRIMHVWQDAQRVPHACMPRQLQWFWV